MQVSFGHHGKEKEKKHSEAKKNQPKSCKILTNNFYQTSSVTSMITNLDGWQQLETCC